MDTGNKKSTKRTLVMIALALIVLASGVAAFAYFQATAPTMRRARPKVMPTVVDVMTAKPGSSRAVITAMGTVVPSTQVTLKARVAGEVMEIAPSFTPGGHVSQGQEMVRLDPADYEVQLKKAQSALAKQKANYKIELGNQEVARAELKLMKQSSKIPLDDTDLALRKPQLNQAQADVASAEAELNQARLNLERTVIKAPFNALITERSVNLGSQVASQGNLATMVGTDEYWIEAAIPLDRLAKLNLRQPGGAPVEVSSQATGATWQGRTLRLTGTLSSSSRMAKVIIAVPDPLGLQNPGARPPLMLDDYVSVEILGGEIEKAIELPRSALRDNNSVWVLSGGKLEVRQVSLAWKEGERVFVKSGLQPGDEIVTSELTIPVPGMSLMTARQAESAQADASGPKAGKQGGPGIKPEGRGPGQGGPGRKPAAVTQAGAGS